jgi:DNA adenine methylase
MAKKNFQPIIKWSGSKRSQAEHIISFFPKEIDTYYEPFCGGCSVLRALIESNIKVNEYICSDINLGLIELLRIIKNDPISLYNNYETFYEELNKDNDINRQKEYYNFIRNRYNEEKSPLDFLCINRTCFNGLIRYNSNGQFNSSFHLNRPGIEPKKLKKLLMEWSDLFIEKNVGFYTLSYEKWKPNKNDFLYLDPPYNNTKGMYYDNFDQNMFFEWLRQLPCGYALSYDGKSGQKDNTYDIPKDLYDEHMYLASGNSSFKRIKEIDKNANVFESLYLKK